MVTDSARKKAARAHAQAAGLPYTAAARQPARGRDGSVSAIGVHTDLMQALQRAGWPTEYETIPENVQYRGYAGPARLTVGRPTRSAAPTMVAARSSPGLTSPTPGRARNVRSHVVISGSFLVRVPHRAPARLTRSKSRAAFCRTPNVQSH
jgi:hypothetical protein